MASQVPPKKNTAFNYTFQLYKNDGTLIGNPGTITAKVMQDFDGTWDTIGTVTEIESTYGMIKAALTAGEMNADVVNLYFIDDTSGCVAHTVTLYTTANLLDDIKTDTAAILSDTGTDGVKLASNAITAATYANDTLGKPLHSGTAQTGSTATITLASGAVATNAYYDGAIVQIVSGTGAGQARIVNNYVGATKICQMTENWATAPDNTSVYVIHPLSDVEVGTNHDKTGYSLATTPASATDMATLLARITAAVALDSDMQTLLTRITGAVLLAANYTAPLDAAGTRTALGMASDNMDTQLAGIAGNAAKAYGMGRAIGHQLISQELIGIGYCSSVTLSYTGTITGNAFIQIRKSEPDASANSDSNARISLDEDGTLIGNLPAGGVYVEEAHGTISGAGVFIKSYIGTGSISAGVLTVTFVDDLGSYSRDIVIDNPNDFYCWVAKDGAIWGYTGDGMGASAHGPIRQESITNVPTVEEIRTEMDANSTKLTSILEDTATTIPALFTTLSPGTISAFSTGNTKTLAATATAASHPMAVIVRSGLGLVRDHSDGVFKSLAVVITPTIELQEDLDLPGLFWYDIEDENWAEGTYTALLYTDEDITKRPLAIHTFQVYGNVVQGITTALMRKLRNIEVR